MKTKYKVYGSNSLTADLRCLIIKPMVGIVIELAKLVVIAAVVLVFMLDGGFVPGFEAPLGDSSHSISLGAEQTGPWGVLQTAADALKLFQKEDVIPCGADRWLFIIAPAMVFIPAYLVYVVIPFGSGITASYGSAGHGLNIGAVYLSAVSSIGVIGIIVAGWASNNKWSLLGAFRGAAQLIAYEVPIILAVCIPVLISGSLNLNVIVRPAGARFPALEPVSPIGLPDDPARVPYAAHCGPCGNQRDPL